MHLHDANQRHDEGIRRAEEDDDGVERFLIFRHKLADNGCGDVAHNHRQERIADGDGNILEAPFAVHQAGNRPVADAQQQVQHQYAAHFPQGVDRSLVDVVDDKARKQSVQREAQTEEDNHEDGNGDASLFAVANPVKAVRRMGHRVEQLLPLFFAEQ